MMQLTEEQRKALITDCKQSIDAYEENYKTWGESWRAFNESHIIRQKIAMAALTAKPVGTIRIEMDWNTHRNTATVNMRPDLVLAEMKNGDELFTRPAPAINLAELVPDESELADRHIKWLSTLKRPMFSDEDWEELTLYTWLAFRDSYRIHRAAILRKIEEAK